MLTDFGLALRQADENPDNRKNSIIGTPAYLSPEQALESFARHFLTWVSRWTNDGFAPVRESWLARAAHLGKEIEVRLPNETVGGIFAELGPNGELLLDTAAGRRIVTAGDVHLPGIG